MNARGMELHNGKKQSVCEKRQHKIVKRDKKEKERRRAKKFSVSVGARIFLVAVTQISFRIKQMHGSQEQKAREEKVFFLPPFYGAARRRRDGERARMRPRGATKRACMCARVNRLHHLVSNIRSDTYEQLSAKLLQQTILYENRETNMLFFVPILFARTCFFGADPRAADFAKQFLPFLFFSLYSIIPLSRPRRSLGDPPRFVRPSSWQVVCPIAARLFARPLSALPALMNKLFFDLFIQSV